ncbi:MAG TPA: ThuA domain-containing protein [Rariglobus sp.]|jgi:type 1 glutamine amidotransferase/HEAT repeat protein|nr:ThuA domain-containing protein [Rariglobus sp.]
MSAAPLPFRPHVLLFALVLGAFCEPVFAEPGHKFAPITSEQNAAIEAALPAHARAKPLKPRKLLIFFRTEGFVHDSIPIANEALKRMGETTGAYTSVVSDDMAMFDAATLNTFDGVIFVSSTGLKFENPAHRKALLDFVAAGKGVMGLHAATDNFPKWPEGQTLMGGVFHGHPWGAGTTVAVKLDDPDNVIDTAFDHRGFWVKDEIYQIMGPYGRDHQRVLLSLDMSRPENAQPASKIQRTDNDFPISWIKNVGAGRVFYSSLGHNKDIYFVPSILQHFLDGIQFALGDLPADAVPSANLPKQPVPALAPDDKTTLQDQAARRLTSAVAISDATYTELATMDGNNPPVALGTVESTLRARAPQQRLAEEPKLLALLEASATTIPAKQAIIRMLAWAGSAKAVPVLEKQAANADLTNYVASALADIEDPSAEAALIRLVSSAPATGRVAAINALALRGASGADAIAVLRRAALGSAADTAQAALEALARIDSPEAFDVLRTLPRDGAAADARTQAFLNAADHVVHKTGATPAAITAAAVAARDILATSKSTPLRVESARLLLVAGGPKAVAQLLPLVKDSAPTMRKAIARSLVLSGYPEALKSLLADFATLQPDAQQTILSIVEQSGSSTLLPFAQAGLATTDDDTRELAILAAGRAGNETTIDTLLPLLAAPGDIGKSAKLALGYLPTGKVDASLRTKLAAAKTPGDKATLLRILADRQDREVFKLALASTQDADKDLRAAAFEAVSKLVHPGDLADVLPLSAFIKTGSDRRDWQKSVFITAGTHANPAEAVKLLQAAISTPNAKERPVLIGALTVIDGDESAKALRALLAIPDAGARKEVIRALSAARTEGAFTLLLETAKNTTDTTERILALRGYLDTVDSQHLNDEKRVAAYRAAWPLASRTEEKDAIIAAVKRINPNNGDAKKFLKEFAPADSQSESKA